jgi:hypothetical protein
MKACWSLLLLLWCLLLAPERGHARSFPFVPDAEEAAQQRWGSRFGGAVLEGCDATILPPLTVQLGPCRAMALDSTSPATLAGYAEESSRTLTLPSGAGTTWIVGRRHPALDAPGWTCQPGQHYCWQQASSPPTLPPGMTWLWEATVSGGALTALADISTRTIVSPLALTQPRTLGRLAQWTVSAGGTIDLASGVTLQVGGCLDAGVQRVFTGANALTGVRWADKARCSTVRPEWWGALGDGVSDGQQTYFKAASDALPFGGILLAAGPTAHYVFTAGWNITTSGLFFDGQMALFSSTTTGVLNLRFDVNANVGQAGSGNKALLLRNVHLRNWRVGVDNTPTQTLLGARLQGCEHCSVENVFKKGATTTAFNMYNCYDCRVANLHIEGSNGTGFGLLAHFIFDSLIENIYITQGDSANGPSWALQIKGGATSRVVNCAIAGIADPDSAQAFFNRGDDPDADSFSSPIEQPYPWPTNGALDCTVQNCYSLPDPRRASISMVFDNLTVTDAPYMKAFATQESYGDIWTNLIAHNVRSGWTAIRSNEPGSIEKNYTLDGFRFTSLGTTAGLGTSGMGVQVRGADLLVPPANLEGVRVANGVIVNAAAEGVLVTYTTDVLVTGMRILNVGLNIPGAAALRIGQDALRPGVVDNYIRDDQNPPTLSYGVFVTNNAIRPTVIGNRVECPHCVFGTFQPLSVWTPGFFSANAPALCTARTTDATPVTDRCRVLLKTDDVISIVAKCAAKEGQTNRAYYEKHFLVWNNAGTAATLLPAAAESDTIIESTSAWDVSYTNTLDDWWLSLVGAAGQTVDWYCNLETIPID